MCEAVKKVLKEERIEGLKEGEIKAKKESTLKMLKKGFDYETIAELNAVSVELVRAWEEEACAAS